MFVIECLFSYDSLYIQKSKAKILILKKKSADKDFFYYNLIKRFAYYSQNRRFVLLKSTVVKMQFFLQFSDFLVRLLKFFV